MDDKDIKEMAMKVLGSGPQADEIFVMRHGKTALDPAHRSDGWLDFPLSDDGRVRLLTAEQFLKSIPIQTIYAPTLKRTKESAEILQSGILSHPAIKDADEAKTWNLGAIAGTPKKPNREIVAYFMKHPADKPEGGESREEFRKRFLPWLDARKADAVEKHGPFLLILSGSNIREISAALFGDESILDLDEGGLMVMYPVDGKWHAEVLFGPKDTDNDWLS